MFQTDTTAGCIYVHVADREGPQNVYTGTKGDGRVYICEHTIYFDLLENSCTITICKSTC